MPASVKAGVFGVERIVEHATATALLKPRSVRGAALGLRHGVSQRKIESGLHRALRRRLFLL